MALDERTHRRFLELIKEAAQEGQQAEPAPRIGERRIPYGETRRELAESTPRDTFVELVNRNSSGVIGR